MSILEDYDHDYSDHEFRDIEEELLDLCGAAQAISQFGINPTAVAVMKATNLLSEASLEVIALEDYGFHYKNDNESKIALESILDTIKEKAKTWSTKITSFMKDKFKGLGSVVKSLFQKAVEGTKSVKEKVLSHASKSKDFVKAHPYKTLMMVATAAVSVMGILGFVKGGLPSFKDHAKLPGFLDTLTKMINAIKWPFGKLIASLTKNKKRIVLSIGGIAAATTVATIAKLGYTNNNADTLTSLFSKVGNGFQALWDGISSKQEAIVRDATSIAANLGKGAVQGFKQGVNAVQPLDAPNSLVGNVALTAASGVAGVAGASLMVAGVTFTSIVYVLYQLSKVILIGGLRLLVSTFNRLKEGKPENPQYV